MIIQPLTLPATTVCSEHDDKLVIGKQHCGRTEATGGTDSGQQPKRTAHFATLIGVAILQQSYLGTTTSDPPQRC